MIQITSALWLYHHSPWVSTIAEAGEEKVGKHAAALTRFTPEGHAKLVLSLLTGMGHVIQPNCLGGWEIGE